MGMLQMECNLKRFEITYLKFDINKRWKLGNIYLEKQKGINKGHNGNYLTKFKKKYGCTVADYRDRRRKEKWVGKPRNLKENQKIERSSWSL